MGVNKNDRGHTLEPVLHGDHRDMSRRYCGIRCRLAEEIATWIDGRADPSFASLRRRQAGGRRV